MIPLALIELWVVPPIAAGEQQPSQSLPPARSQLVIESGTSVGNLHIFAYAGDRRFTPVSIEYDRRFKDRLPPLHCDYIVGVMPVIFLREPAEFGPDSKPLTSARQTNYGVGLFPGGLRLYWGRERTWQPYLLAKGGFLYFGQRPLSPESAKLNIATQMGGGMDVALNPHLRLRLGFSDFHFSDGNTAAKNPGIDFMYFSAGLSWRLGKQTDQE